MPTTTTTAAPLLLLLGCLKSCDQLFERGLNLFLKRHRVLIGSQTVGQEIPDVDQVVAKLPDNVGENDVWLITHPEFRRDPKVRATADFLKKIASEREALN